MILPSSHIAALILLVVGMLGWGLWANTFKTAGGKWRFELFYFDFAVGVFLLAVLLALTAGRLGFDGFSVEDDLRLAGKRQELFALVAGAVFNLGNMLLLGAVSVAGMSVAFPIAMGFGLIVAAGWQFLWNPGGNVTLLFVGMALVCGAIVLAALTSKSSAVNTAAPGSESAVPKKRRKRSSAKAVLLSLAGGLLLGSFWQFIQMAQTGENGLGPYSTGSIFSLGVLFSTFVFNLFFMNLPVQGDPIDIAEYLRAGFKSHLPGFCGGALWYAGLITTLIVARVEGPAAVPAQLSYALEQAAIVVAALCGVFLWREFDGAQPGTKLRLGLMLFLLIAGIGLSAAGIAPAAAPNQ